MDKLVVYIDGSYGKRGGVPRAGWGCIFIDGAKIPKRIVAKYSESGAVPDSFASELEAFLLALRKAPKDTDLEIFCDSQAIVYGYNERINTPDVFKMRGKSKTESNHLRWTLAIILARKLNLKVTWIKSHSGDFFNTRVDQLAEEAKRSGSNFIVDPCKRISDYVNELSIATPRNFV